VAGEDRLIAVEDSGRYRDALGANIPHGVPEAFLDEVPDALLQLVRRWARTHGPFVAGEPAARLGVTLDRAEAVLRDLVDEGRIERGAFRPDGTDREWCDVEVLRLLRQRSLAVLRREVEPVAAETLARFLPAWHGVGSDGRGLDRLFEIVGQLEGYAIPASVLETDVLRSRMEDYSPRLLDELLASGEVMWVGGGSIGRDDGRVVLLRRARAALLLPRLPGSTSDGPELDTPLHDQIRQVLAERGACFFRELGGADDRETIDALWDLVWAGVVTNDSFAAVRAAVSGRGRKAAAPRAGRARPGSLTVLGPPKAQGRWSLVERELAGLPAASPTESGVALAGTLLERHGVLTREAVRGEGMPGGFAGVYAVLRAMEEGGRVRRGYFVAGLGGAQFALPGAVDRLRGLRGNEGRPEALVLAATDPANAYGLALPWPEVVSGPGRPARVAGAYVVVVDGLASLYIERGGKGLIPLRECDGTWEEVAVAALDQLLGSGRFSKLAVQRYPEPLEPLLRASSFVPTPKGLVRYA
jgi:ATP-dependent helicase Lhr and Lhr-like helicase